MKIVRFCDLDNTLIFSHRYNIEAPKIVVEYLNGKEQAYMLEQAYNKLQILEKKLFVPVTSRTIEQYNRIRFYRDGKKSYYSLVDNGGLLLIDGIESPEWKRDTIELVHDDLLIMKDIFNNLKEFGEIKWQDELVIFMKPFSDESEKKIIILCKENGLLTFNHGSKLYICSKKLNKGEAVRRFLELYRYDGSIAAGDSVVDLSMGLYVDELILDKDLKLNYDAISASDCLNEEQFWIINAKTQYVDKYEIADVVLGRK